MTNYYMDVRCETKLHVYFVLIITKAMSRWCIREDNNINTLLIIQHKCKFVNAPVSKIESEAQVQAASRGGGERKTGNSEFWEQV